MHKRHFNQNYATIGTAFVPVGANDRYYAQDLSRDMRYLESIGGRVMLERLKLSTALLSGGVVTEGSSKALINISAASGLCEFTVSVSDDDETWSVPAATKSDTIVQCARSPSLVDFSLEDATLNGIATNYVKLRYAEATVQTRTRTNAAGTYAYSIEESYEIVCDDEAPTNLDVVLATLIGDGTTTLTITQVDPVTDETMQQIKASLTSYQGNDIEALIAMRKHDVGEPVFNILLKTASATFPAVRIDDGDHDIAAANWPELVPALRAEQMSVTGVSSFTGTVSGSTLTLATSTAGDALLADLVEDAKVHGGDVETENYTNGRSINIAGTDYAITAINGGTRAVSVSGSPPTGSQTVLFFPHRIAGSTTTARLFRTSARSIVSGGDAAGTILPGLRRRDYGQRITGSFGPSDRGFSVSPTDIPVSGAITRKIANAQRIDGGAGSTTTGFDFDSALSPNARAGDRTEPRALGAYLYIWGGRYVA